MRIRVWFFAICMATIWVSVGIGSALAYYYPPTNVPPGPPPNYNQVDTTYFMGTPELPLPPPDSGGMFVYYDQGSWCVANHIYSKGNSLEQFHSCVLAVMNQPPTLGVNVFIEEFEFWGDTAASLCLKQNDRWGWIPWGDNLYEIWWDMTTREWKFGEGDPNDFMCFRIGGCAIDFNFYSSGHNGVPFGPDQIFLGAGKTPLSSVPGFVDTYPGVSDPYQSQAGTSPEDDPNLTIFTLKNDTLRSYNNNGLIDPTDSYTCDLALEYGQRYAGTFAYEGNGVQFSTSNLCPPNQNPNIMITPDTSVFVCSADSVRIWIFASDPDPDDTITVDKIYGMGTYDPKTDLTPIYDQFYFHPETSGVYMFIFRVTDNGGLTDEDTTLVTVQLDRPPQLTCPDDDSVQAGDLFVSSDFSASDPDGETPSVGFLDIDPPALNAPTVVGSHVEWLTGSDETGDYTIRLVATDACLLADICEFTVTVVPPPLDFVCPDDDSVHAGEVFVSTDFYYALPFVPQMSVSLCGVDPAPVQMPLIVENHVEWQTECDDAGKVFTICLEATDDCGRKDTCHFDVTVYNRPPELICPDDGAIYAGQTFVSNDFSATDPDGDPVSVSLLGVEPSPTVAPSIEGNHVEWGTTSSENGDYTISLVGTDPCGLADTCQFVVTVNEPTGVFECPEDDSVHAGELFTSTDFVLTHPDCDPSSVVFVDITPPATHDPTMVDYHVEWQTTCQEDGDYVIRLRTNESCSIEDTCSFTVTVYNRPPELTCPDYGIVEPMHLFISTDFDFDDPDGDDVTVSLLGIDPPAEYDPVIVERHVEWQTTCVFGDYIITLVATDPCGLADTCEFMVTLSFDPVPDFYIWVHPITAYVSQGNSADYLVELNSMNGYHEACSLSVTGLPIPPDSAVFHSAVMTPTDFTTMTVYTSPSTDTGIYTLTVTGKEIGRPVAHRTEVYLKVADPLTPLDVEDEADGPSRPAIFTLFQNQPNPFNPQTQISYFLPRDCQVRLMIYNVLGQKVKALFEGYQTTGTHTLTWNGRSDQGNQLSSGIYFYRLQADRFVETKKMTLMK